MAYSKKTETLLLVPFTKMSATQYENWQIALLSRYGKYIDDGYVEFETDGRSTSRNRLEISARYMFTYGEKIEPFNCGLCKHKKYKTMKGFRKHLRDYHRWV